MLDFFKYPDNTRSNVNIAFSQMRYISSMVNLNINMTKDYYRNNDIQVNRNIELVKLLNFLAPKTNLKRADYMIYVMSESDSLARKFDFNGSSRPYNILESQLFNNSVEVYVPVDDNRFMFKSDEEIMEMMPIRPIYTENDRVEYELFNAQYNLYGSVIVMEINIPLIAVMWYIYLNSGRTNTPFSFINGYIYPNMLNQFINLSMLGRLKTYYYTRKREPRMLKQDYVRYVKTNDVTNRIEDVVKSYFKLFYNRAFPLKTLIHNIPSVNYDLVDTMQINASLSMNQAQWIKWLAVTPYARFVLDFMGVVGRRFNRDRIFDLGYDIKLLRTNNFNLWKLNSPKGCIEQLKEDVEYIKEHYMSDEVKSMK